MLIEWIKEMKWGYISKAQIYNILKVWDIAISEERGVPEADKQQQEVFKEALKKTDRKS